MENKLPNYESLLKLIADEYVYHSSSAPHGTCICEWCKSVVSSYNGINPSRVYNIYKKLEDKTKG